MDFYENLQRWQELQTAIERLQAEEKVLREGLFNGTFPNPVEGTNTYVLPDGRKIKGTYKIYRNVDEKALASSEIPKKLKDEVFRVKHDLSVTAYRNLDEELKKLVDTVLTIKPGMPGLDVIAAPVAE